MEFIVTASKNRFRDFHWASSRGIFTYEMIDSANFSTNNNE